jgi:glycosyltransferase involved in cell wall biosynthesis
MKILIISQGPIPLNAGAVVEGGGVRAHALWKGLMGLGFPTVLAVPTWAHNEINTSVLVYEDSQSLCKIASQFDAIIYNFAAGSLVFDLLNSIPVHILRIADVYVPIHVEVSARRNLGALNVEEKNFQEDLLVWNSNLMMSDIFLASSQAQATYYLGILSSLGKISPKTYDQELIYVCPTGSDSTITVKKTAGSESLSILWWGGFYPWFKPEDLKSLAKELSMRESEVVFQIVGAKNPFVENKQFVDTAQMHLKNLSSSPNISIAPWVPFDKREQVFSKSHVVMILSQSGYENGLSWRTRLIDAVDFETPVITNGGDPFSEFLISEGAALRIPSNPTDIASFLINDLTPIKLAEMSEQMKHVKSKISFEECVRPLVRLLRDSTTTHKLITERIPIRKISTSTDEIQEPQKIERRLIRRGYYHYRLFGLSKTIKKVLQKTWSKMWSLIFQLNSHEFFSIRKISTSIDEIQEPQKIKRRLIRRGYHHYRLFGFSRTLKKVVQKTWNKLRSLMHQTRSQELLPTTVSVTGEPSLNLLIIQHQTDKSGAPLVGIEMAKALHITGKRKVTIVSGSPIDHDLELDLRTSGIDLIPRVTHESIKDLLSDSNFMINSSATSEYWILEALDHLERNEEVRGSFFIHENEPNLFLSDAIAVKVGLLSKVRLKVFVPSVGALKKIGEIYGDTIHLSVQNYRVSNVPITQLDRKIHEINVALVGPTGDFRKRHIDVILATAMAIRSNPSAGRKINLKLIGIGDDLIGSEVRRLARELIPVANLEIFGRLPKKQVLQILSLCNTVVSVADNESFGLYLAEAMTGGAVVLRTQISGYEEQVVENVNGYGLVNPIFDLSERLSDLANPEVTSDDQLFRMLESSIQISQKFVNSNYEDVLKHFND